MPTLQRRLEYVFEWLDGRPFPQTHMQPLPPGTVNERVGRAMRPPAGRDGEYVEIRVGGRTFIAHADELDLASD